MLLFCSAVAFAGAWVRDPGAAYVKLGTSTFFGAEAAAGSMVPIGSYADVAVSAYGEVGLPLGFELSAYVPYVLARNEFEGSSFVGYGGGDAEAFLGKRILAGPVALSAAVGAKLPMYEDRGDSRAAAWGGYSTRFPNAGDGQVDLEARVAVGGSFKMGSLPGWAQGGAGYRHRFGDYVDGVSWNAQIGASPGKEGARGWVGVDAAGLVNVEPSVDTRTHTRFGVFGALPLGKGFAFEAHAGVIPWAEASRTGGGGGFGLSYMRSGG